MGRTRLHKLNDVVGGVEEQEAAQHVIQALGVALARAARLLRCLAVCANTPARCEDSIPALSPQLASRSSTSAG